MQSHQRKVYYTEKWRPEKSHREGSGVTRTIHSQQLIVDREKRTRINASLARWQQGIELANTNIKSVIAVAASKIAGSVARKT